MDECTLEVTFTFQVTNSATVRELEEWMKNEGEKLGYDLSNEEERKHGVYCVAYAKALDQIGTFVRATPRMVGIDIEVSTDLTNLEVE